MPKLVKKKKFAHHPWKEWFKKREFTLHQGTDFNGRLYTMAQQVRTYASKKGRSVSLDIDETKNMIHVKLVTKKKKK